MANSIKALSFGSSWLDAMHKFYVDRNPRAFYSDAQQFGEISIEHGKIFGKSKSWNGGAQNVSIELKKFTEAEKEIIADNIQRFPSVLAQLMDEGSIVKLQERLATLGIHLFPSSINDWTASCSCSKSSGRNAICQHIAGLIYCIGLKLERNPRSIFLMHGLPVSSLAPELHANVARAVYPITKTSQLLRSGESCYAFDGSCHPREGGDDKNGGSDESSKQLPSDNPTPPKLPKLELSKISNLGKTIPQMLSEYASFYTGNIRDLFIASRQERAHRPQQAAALAKKECRRPRQQHEFWTEEEDEQQESGAEYFSRMWSEPELWQEIHLVVDGLLMLDAVIDKKKHLIKPLPGKAVNVRLAAFLGAAPKAVIVGCTYSLQFLHQVHRFAGALMTEQADVPQILQTDDGGTFVRSVPAMFDQAVRKNFDKLCEACPTDLVMHKDKAGKVIQLSKPEQVRAAIDILIHGMLTLTDNDHGFDVWSLGYREKNSNVYRLLFGHEPAQTRMLEELGVPIRISKWLAPLHEMDEVCDSQKKHRLCVIVEEVGEEFALDVGVSLNLSADLVSIHNSETGEGHGATSAEGERGKGSNEGALIDLKQILKGDSDPELRIRVLFDIGLLLRHLPQLVDVVDGEGKTILTLNGFTPLFRNVLPLLRNSGIAVMLPQSLQNTAVKPKVSLDLRIKGDASNPRAIFLGLNNSIEFDWRVTLGKKQLSAHEFVELVAGSSGLVKVQDSYVLLEFADVRALLDRIGKLPTKMSREELMHAALAGSVDDAEVKLDYQLSELFSRLGKYQPMAVPSNLQATLRPYQSEGFSWLMQNMEFGFGSILADDMGLGKTLQVISVILQLKNEGLLADRKVLVVAPTGVLLNWQREVERFAPSIETHIYHGAKRELHDRFDVLITSYGLARRDAEELTKISWFLLIIDEAQNIKNPVTAQSQAIKSINAVHKIAMSGTPVENRLLEYWSIFDFTNKHYLGGHQSFKEKFAAPIEKHRHEPTLNRFLKVTKPFILRRLKTDKAVIKDLPDKIESNCFAELTKEQMALYRRVVSEGLGDIEASEGIERKGLVLKLITALKQICNHPANFTKEKTFKLAHSGKMEMLRDLLLGIEEVGEKVLIFTQYVEMGNILAALLESELGMKLPFLHGSLSMGARDELVQNFMTNPEQHGLIVSLKAGGTGLNLTAANHVIHYDLWWNPAVEAQATDRAFRIGQHKNVMVRRFITKDTFEEKIDAMLQSKKELADIAVNSGEHWITEMTNKQLRDLVEIRRG